MPPVPLSCHKWWAPCPILPATLPRSIYFFLFEIFLALFRAFIAFGYFFHGFGLFNMSKADLWVLYFFYFSSVVDCTLQYALYKAPAWAEKKFIVGKPFFTLSLELSSLLTASCSSLPVGITLVSSCSITGPLFSPWSWSCAFVHAI